MIKSPADKSRATRWWPPSFTGLFLGFLFFVLTFTPSLVPRPPIFQGLLGGLAFFIGYAIGHGGVVLWRYLELPEVPRPWWRAANIVLALACVIAAAIYIPQAAAWQDEVRARMNIQGAEPANLLLVVLIAAVVAAGHGIVVENTKNFCDIGAPFGATWTRARNTRQCPKRKINGLLSHAALLWDRDSAF
jgi:uncharacterized membrane protein